MVYGNGSNAVKFPSVCMEYCTNMPWTTWELFVQKQKREVKMVFLRKRLTRY